MHIFIAYAFCNIDDLSWGTKGADGHGAGVNKYKDPKVSHVAKWILTNIIISYLIITLGTISSMQQIFVVIFLTLTAFTVLVNILGFSNRFVLFLRLCTTLNSIFTINL